ncbi:Flp1 family type IVb pilin [Pseudobutyrivibrio ruminis]|jgi:Flp pilus assembly pilin Flp|uniref:Flp1 family type IVb pilin n=1 Tax=Pseudobutyrivibrio ruminis TaxID=46206 RepID=UPI0004063680|nr:Flp1 family type IVb pilin [Pseudobutyrivibrio ruminis]
MLGMKYLMLKQKVMNFIEEEDGIGTVEMILILVVLIGLVLIFKTQLTNLVNSIFRKINEQAGRI